MFGRRPISDRAGTADPPTQKQKLRKQEKMTIQTQKFARKPFYVDAIQVTEENMQQVAQWCDGTIQGTDAGENFIKVKVNRPLNERQTQAFVNDWILFMSGGGFKIYTPKAFNHSFELVKVTQKGTDHSTTVAVEKSVEEHADEAIEMVEDKPATVHELKQD